MGKVLVIGSLNMDVIAFAPRLPAPGETLLGTRWASAHGGKGGNQAVAAARLGAQVAMVGCVGPDAYGTALREALIAEGIDCRAVRVDSSQPSGLALITVDARSQNTIVVIPGSNAQLSVADIDAQRELFVSANIVVLQLETPLPTVRRAIALAAECGNFVILNPAPAADSAALDAELLARVNLLIPNETEAALLTGMPIASVAQALQAAAQLRARGCPEVIVTLGELGVVYAGDSRETHYAARPVRAVDATAAGDTFIGALAAALAADVALAQAIEFGQTAAALAVTRQGAQSSIPTLEQVKRSL